MSLIEEYISVSTADKFVMAYEKCASCYDESYYGYSSLCETSFVKNDTVYIIQHCCKFPHDSLTSDIWEAIISEHDNKYV